MSRIAAGSFWKTTLAFALVGPPIGGLSLIGWWTYLSFAKDGGIEETPLGLVAIGVFYGYGFGLLPACITGALSSVVSPAVRANGAWVATSAGIGWLVTVSVLGGTGFLNNGPSGPFWNGLIGAIPALLCALLTRGVRPRRP